jgi:hypothetical protein
MRLVVGFDMNVLDFVVAIKLATPRQNLRDYLTGKPFRDPTHLGEDAFGGGLCQFVLQEDARCYYTWIKVFLSIHQTNDQCLKWTYRSIADPTFPLMQV